MPATTDTVLTFDGQEEPNMAKFEIEYETIMHNIQTIGLNRIWPNSRLNMKPLCIIFRP